MATGSGSGGDDALMAIADRLYAAPPARFVAERAAAAKAARADGDRDLAARIGALLKPSASAALVNGLARRDDDLVRLLELGSALREAQDRADRGALQRLTAERRSLLAEVAERAADRAAEAGKRPGGGVLEELQQTLQAALTSEEAADAVRSGRLLRALDADGLGPVDLDRAVAVPGGPPARPTPPPPPDAAQADASAREAEERARARAAVDEARRRAVEARAAADAAASRAAAAEAAVRQRETDETERRTALERAERRLEDAVRASREARAAADDARAAATGAEDAADAADAAATAAEHATRPGSRPCP